MSTMPVNLSDPRLYTVRPFSKPARTDLKDVFRVYLSPSTLLLHKLRSGDPCLLQGPGEQDDIDNVQVPAIAWNASERIQDNIIQTSKVLQDIHSLRLGDKVSIRPLLESIVDVHTITLSEVPLAALEDPLACIDKTETEHWAWFLELPLSRAEILAPGIVLDDVELKGQKRSFKIEQINSSESPDALYRFVSSSSVHVNEGSRGALGSAAELQRSLIVTQDGVGGLTRQLGQLNERLAAYSDSVHKFKLPSYYRPRRGGVLLYGPSGTGKSLLLRKLAEARWTRVFHIDVETIDRYGGNGDAAVRKVFVEARRRQPSVIIIDRLEIFAGRARDHETSRPTNIATTLSEEFGHLSDSRIMVVAATTNLSDIDERLRRPGCFEFQLEMSVPDTKARTEILKLVSATPRDAKVPMLESLGERTHGFVGADLDKLVQLAVDKAKARVMALSSSGAPTGHIVNNALEDHSSSKPDDNQVIVEVIEVDLNNALLEVRPTAMQEVFLETPNVRWTDIGGQQEIKKSLKQAVEWPFKYPLDFARLGLIPRKGLLLYGPPGCSKTLTAQAVATESHLNFLAVKGAELLSMYIGESERAIREVFRKARAAAPSILFFDEIDAIGASRDTPGQHSGLNVLTTLLNELDGIEALKGVFVLAATNKPDILDPALMRPGRLDTMLYVGPPGLEARKEILQIRLSRMEVGEEVDKRYEGLLAESMDGYTGAEMVNVCQRAGYAALEEQECTGEVMRVCKKHFGIALEEVQRQITPEIVTKYESWAGRLKI